MKISITNLKFKMIDIRINISNKWMSWFFNIRDNTQSNLKSKLNKNKMNICMAISKYGVEYIQSQEENFN